MDELTIIQLEVNEINGFVLSLLGINNKELLGLHFSKDYLIINLLFFNIIDKQF